MLGMSHDGLFACDNFYRIKAASEKKVKGGLG
jgi:hypothetical protein